MKLYPALILAVLAFSYLGHARASEEHGHEHGHGDEEENVSRIDDAMATQVGIGTAEAAPQTLHQTVTSYGVLTTSPEQLSHVRARFSGLISAVKATIGDVVRAGDILAIVESNESLKKYTVRAPISGTVVQRHANTGEATQDQVLFSIANFDNLWAEFRIYPAQQAKVSPGQVVHITSSEWKTQSTVRHIIPSLDKPYQLARVLIDNSTLGLSPGLLVEGHVAIGEIPVELAVEKDAVQMLGGRPGVFIKEGNQYRFTPLILGRRDDRYTEAIQGIQPGQVYVTQNSYLIKADIEKSEAEHSH